MLGVVDDCAAAGVKALVVVTAGFAEVGADGRALQQQLVDKVRGYGMRMVGPNCLGLLNTDPAVVLNASFSPLFPQAGTSRSVVAERGAGHRDPRRWPPPAASVSRNSSASATRPTSPATTCSSIGKSDPRTRVILLYLESFGNPRRFARLARRISRSKPIVAIKAGRTRAGSRAAGSHTAALAANDTAVEALFHQSGVIRAGTIDEMFDIATCLDAQPLPAGRRVAIVTNAGGPGILAADACVAAGLTVAEFCRRHVRQARRVSAADRERRAIPSTWWRPQDPSEYRQAIEVAATADDADALIVHLHAGRYGAIRRDPRRHSRRHPRRARHAAATPSRFSRAS